MTTELTAGLAEQTAAETAIRDAQDLIERFPPAQTDDRVLRGARFDAGLAFPHFDLGYGGRGLEPGLHNVIEQLFLRAGCVDWRNRNIIGLGMAAPTIHEHGTKAQRDELLRPLFTGEEVWCQLFSEPGAGSDLAGLATSARADGGSWVVNGQKVWTTLGHVARRGLLIARTDPGVVKHAGLTFFLLDMRSPGVEVRPLRQLTGEAEFNEVYLTDVVVPDTDRIGDVGAGWAVARTTLMNERTALGGSGAPRGAGAIGEAVTLYRAAAAAGRAGPVQRDRLMQLWVRAEVARLTSLRASTAQGEGGPGPEGSVAKLHMAEGNKAVQEFCVDLQGPAGQLISTYELTRPESAALLAGVDPAKSYLRSMANSIEGGTSEIMRNVLAERMLGLPAEARADRGPWSEIPRS
jgi:alkylation response protein AidB-like acyl-CoA dehydrogenase